MILVITSPWQAASPWQPAASAASVGQLTVNSRRTLPSTSFSSIYRHLAQAAILTSLPEACTAPQPISVSSTAFTGTPVSSSSRTFCRRVLFWASSLSSSSIIWQDTGAAVL